MDYPAFVFGDGAEGTAAKAAPHNVHGKADHLIGGNAGIAIGWVGNPLKRQFKHIIQFFGGKGNRRWVHPQKTLGVFLHQRARVGRVGFQMQHPGGVGVQHRVLAHLFIGGQ